MKTCLMKSQILWLLNVGVIFLGSANFLQAQTSDSGPNADALVQQIEQKQASVQARIREIDTRLDPYLEKSVSRLFAINLEEYKMMRLQSQNPEGARTYFTKLKNRYRDSLQGVGEYFDDAHAAIKAGHYWFGSGDKMLQKDQQLYGKMREIIEQSLAKQPDGPQIIKLMEEREELVQKKVELGPMHDYLVKRRKWWNYLPDYKEALRE